MNYGMFTDEGNKMVSLMVEECLKLPITAKDEEIYAFLNTRMSNIERAGHGEVYDTEVREQLISKIEKETKRELSIYF